MISKRAEPPLEAWLRRQTLNTGFLRPLAALLRRTEWIVFVLLVGSAYLIVSNTTWPSRAFFLKLVFNLGFAWLVVSVLSVSSNIAESRSPVSTVISGVSLVPLIVIVTV